GTDADAAAAINYAARHGARISNNSWGGGGASQAIYDAIKNAGDVGHLFIAAAGNEASDDDTSDFSPASFSRPTSAGPGLNNIVVVAATDNRDELAGFSNYGPNSVHLGAPGVDVWSTKPGNTYGYLSGTSMATPHVTGAAALLWGFDPSRTYQEIKSALL